VVIGFADMLRMGGGRPSVECGKEIGPIDAF